MTLLIFLKCRPTFVQRDFWACHWVPAGKWSNRCRSGSKWKRGRPQQRSGTEARRGAPADDAHVRGASTVDHNLFKSRKLISNGKRSLRWIKGCPTMWAGQHAKKSGWAYFIGKCNSRQEAAVGLATRPQPQDERSTKRDLATALGGEDHWAGNQDQIWGLGIEWGNMEWGGYLK